MPLRHCPLWSHNRQNFLKNQMWRKDFSCFGENDWLQCKASVNCINLAGLFPFETTFEWLETSGFAFTPGECDVVGLQSQQAASCEMAVLVVVDDRCPMQQKLVNVWLQRQHVPMGGWGRTSQGCMQLCVCGGSGSASYQGMSSVPWLNARCVSSVPWNSSSFTSDSDDKSPSESDRSPTMNLRLDRRRESRVKIHLPSSILNNLTN